MDLIDKIVAAYKEAIAANTHPDTPVRSEAQNAAILAAQVKEILNHYSSEDVLLSRIVALEGQVAGLMAAANTPAPQVPVPAAAAPVEPDDAEDDGEDQAEDDAELIAPGDAPAEHEDET